MMRRFVTSGLLLKGAALVVFLGVLGGATYGVQTFLGEDALAPLLVQVEPARPALNATAGHAVTFPLVLHNRGEVALRAVAQATGDGVQASAPEVIVPAAGNATVFLTVQVPADAAPGERTLAVTLADPATGATLRERPGLLTLRVLSAATGFGEGDVANVRYTGRLASTGKVFDSNDPFVIFLNLPRADSFQPHGSDPLPVDHDDPRVIEGFFEGLQGMQPGESRAVTFPPEKGYGPATTPTEVERDEPLERIYGLDLAEEAVDRAVFNDYVNRTGQGDPATFEAGDVFRFEQGPNKWPYLITAIDAREVKYVLDVKVGEGYTLYPFWEGASKVIDVNETTALFETTPTTDVGEAFTMRAYWPDMSAVSDITADTIVVRHSPPVSFKFQQPASQFAPTPREAVIQEVRDDVIIVGVKSDHPLAGEALTFDVELLSLTR